MTILFWILTFITVSSGVLVIAFSNPIYSALSLVMTMVGIAGFFVLLNAYFLAGVQLIVYAGAVLVLFIMVLMLFDLKTEKQAFSKGDISGFLKVATVGLFLGLMVGVILISHSFRYQAPGSGSEEGASVTQAAGFSVLQLGKALFSQYLFEFEILGVLLLIVAIGAVALARSRGGTHAKH